MEIGGGVTGAEETVVGAPAFGFMLGKVGSTGAAVGAIGAPLNTAGIGNVEGGCAVGVAVIEVGVFGESVSSSALPQ
jgi:hypothetical protein